MNIFETNTDIISQGNVRRGSFAAYLDIEHDDIEEFLEIREVGHSIQNMSIGICIGDEWMEDMIRKPKVLKDRNLKIHASNLCLRGDSIIEVLFPFYDDSKEIDIETFVKLWNIGGVAPGTKVKTEQGFEEITAAAQTGSTTKMIRITDESTGKIVECTPDHQVYTQNRGWVQAKDLNEDDELLLE